MRGCFNRVEETSRVTQLSLSSVTPALPPRAILKHHLSPSPFPPPLLSTRPPRSLFLTRSFFSVASHPPRDVCGVAGINVACFCTESAFPVGERNPLTAFRFPFFFFLTRVFLFLSFSFFLSFSHSLTLSTTSEARRDFRERRFRVT